MGASGLGPPHRRAAAGSGHTRRRRRRGDPPKRYQKPARRKPPAGKIKKVTAEQRARAFARWDTNQDGLVTLDQYTAGLKGESNFEARFKSFDNNGDGKLTRGQFVIPDP